MAEEIFVSICIPAYLRTELLKRLLDSIHIQSYRKFEVVLTDDSPGTEVLELVRLHPLQNGIRYFKNAQTLGTPENWNESIRRAEGEWIKLMHDDDWFSGRDSLLNFVKAVNSESVFYFSEFTNVYPGGKNSTIRAGHSFLRSLNRQPAILLAGNRIGPPSAVLFKKDLSLVFNNKYKWVVDFDFYIRYLLNHRPASFIPKNLINIGISDSQVTQSSFGNPVVEIPERFSLWENLNTGNPKNIRIYDSWWRFIRNLKVSGESKIRAAGYQGPIPDFIKSIIRWQNRIPGFLLNPGIFSKPIMFIHYLFHLSS